MIYSAYSSYRIRFALATAGLTAAASVAQAGLFGGYNLIVLDDLSGGNGHIHGSAIVENVSGVFVDLGADLAAGSTAMEVGGINTGTLQGTGGAKFVYIDELSDNLGSVQGSATLIDATYDISSLLTGFAAQFSTTTGLSYDLSQLATNGSVDLSDNNSKTFFAGVGDLSVVTINASDLSSGGWIAPALAANQYLVINVLGATVNAGANQNGSWDSIQDQVLWNFFQATDISLGTKFNGSVVAPNAKLTHSNDIWGSVIVSDLEMHGQIHPNEFGYTFVVVPEPSAFLFFGSASAISLLLIRRRRTV